MKICLIDPQPNVLIGWDWSNPDEDTTCGGEFSFDCSNDTTECPKFECTNNHIRSLAEPVNWAISILKRLGRVYQSPASL